MKETGDAEEENVVESGGMNLHSSYNENENVALCHRYPVACD